MKGAIGLLLMEAAVASAELPMFNVYKPRTTHLERREAARLAKRATITETLGNGQNLYFANVSVGTPPQALQLQVDTGSSDVWMTATGDEFCREQQGNCAGGTFDRSKSSTYNLVSQGGFSIQYVDRTGSTGDFFNDTFRIGGQTITNLQMGLATNTTIGTGIVGLGFAADESVCAQSAEEGPCNTYPTLVDQMVMEKKINSHAYSLWLNDLDANTGSVLFGGVDTKKYMGELVTLPIQPDSQSNSITSFTVSLTNFTLGTPNGDQGGFVNDDFNEPAILDSGTTLTLLPDALALHVLSEFGAQNSRELESFIAPCSLRRSTATFNFGFGGPNGPVIRVPINEMLLDVGTDARGNPLTFRNGEQVCAVGVEPAGNRPILLGDTFLRSAYVVYDLDNQQISLAQTDFNAFDSNIQEIQSGRNGVPNVASTATAASSQQTETGLPGIGGLGGLFGGFGSGSGGNGVITSALPVGTVAPLAQYTAVNTNSPEPSGGNGASSGPGSSTSSGAAAHGVTVPRWSGEGLSVGLIMSFCAAIGSAIVLL